MKLNNTNAVKTISTVVREIAKGDLSLNLSFQRPYVWNAEQRNELIDSILLGFPINEMHVVRISDAEGTEEIKTLDGNGNVTIEERVRYKILYALDGLQRLTTILTFVTDEWALSDYFENYEYDGVIYNWSGKKFSELPEFVRDDIKSYNINFSVCLDIPEQMARQMFWRINNGKSVNGIVKARCMRDSVEDVKEIAQHELFTDAYSKNQISGFSHEDLIYKLLVMLQNETEENGERKYPCLQMSQMKSFIAEHKISESEISNVKEDLTIIKNVHDMIIDDGKKFEETKKFNKLAKKLYTPTHMVSFINLVDDYKTKVSVSDFHDFFSFFYDADNGSSIDADYNDRASQGANQSSSVRIRCTAIERAFLKYFDYMFNVAEGEENEEEIEVMETETESVTESESETATE